MRASLIAGLVAAGCGGRARPPEPVGNAPTEVTACDAAAPTIYVEAHTPLHGDAAPRRLVIAESGAWSHQGATGCLDVGALAVLRDRVDAAPLELGPPIGCDAIDTDHVALTTHGE